MAYGKWIGGVLGWMTGGPLGAIAGYFIGTIIEQAFDAGGDLYGGDTAARGREGERNSFLFSLMVLSSYVIQADGRIMHSEMEYVRQFLRRNFGEAAEQQGEQILRGLFDERKAATEADWRRQMGDVCRQLQRMMPEGQRQQLLAYLMELAKADGSVVEAEMEVLREMASWMGLSAATLDELDHLGENTLEAAYEALGITPQATDAEVRSAYKKMALKYHPDRVATLGEDVRRSAEENFKRVTEARDRIFAARGIK